MFRFESREFLQWLWVLPVIIFAGWFFYRRSLKRLATSIGAKLMPFLTSSLSVKRRRVKWTLECFVVFFFVLALARPQMGTSMQEVKSEGVEMVILFDVSTSMLTEDVKPSRLELAKSEVKRFVDRSSGDKIGLVVFAGSAYVMSPLTTDHSALDMYIDSLTTETVSRQGTEIKPALEEAMAAFKRGGVDEDENSKATRVILIASDGEDQEEGALKYAREISAKGTHIFTMGFGTEQGGPIPERDNFGILKGYKKDDKGQMINSTHHDDFMRQLAAAGRGAYFYAIGGSNQVELLKREVDKLEKAKFDSQLAAEFDERFQVPLMIGLVLALIELLLTERKRALATRREFEAEEVK